MGGFAHLKAATATQSFLLPSKYYTDSDLCPDLADSIIHFRTER